jgi:PTS system glucose-specific IIC component
MPNCLLQQPAQPCGSPCAAAPAAAAADPQLAATASAILAALGGRGNVQQVEAIAHTRLRVQLKQAASLNEAAAREAGVMACVQTQPGTWHLIVGDKAGALAQALQG